MNVAALWTDDRTDRLKALFGDGHSASKIATALGGVSRNAVISKCHRMGLSGQPRPAKPKVEKVRPVPRMPRPAKAERRTPRPRSIIKPTDPGPAIEVPPVYPIGERVTLMMLTEQTCRWPIGDPGSEGFTFCGRHSDAGVPYCTTHTRLAYQAPGRKAG